MEKTDNEIIAEFMGIEVVQYVTHFGTVLAIVPEEGCIDWPELRTFNPDTDWNHLMPVVEKITDMELDSVPAVKLRSLRIDTELWELHLCVVDFIKWYTTQPKQNGN